MPKLSAILLALAFSQALGQGPDHRDRDRKDSSDVLIRINAPVTIPAGDSVGTAVVVNDSVTMDGIVKHALVVVNGTAVVSGTVLEDVVVIKGHLLLLDGARVGRDVKLFRSTISKAPGATVGGTTENQQRFFPGAAVHWAFWFMTLIALLVFGILLVTFGSRQITDAASILVQQTGRSALSGLVVWIGLPLIAVASFFTFIGIPLGLIIFFMLLPALWITGYVVAGLSAGVMLLKRRNSTTNAPHPYLTVVLGIILLHVIWAIPFLGGLIIFVLVWLASGALAYRVWDGRWREKKST